VEISKEKRKRKSPILGLTSYYGYLSGLTLLFSFFFSPNCVATEKGQNFFKLKKNIYRN